MTLQKSSKRQKLNDYPLTISQTNINTYTRSFYGLICQLVSNDLSIIEHVIVRTHKLQYIYILKLVLQARGKTRNLVPKCAIQFVSCKTFERYEKKKWNLVWNNAVSVRCSNWFRSRTTRSCIWIKLLNLRRNVFINVEIVNKLHVNESFEKLQ